MASNGAAALLMRSAYIYYSLSLPIAEIAFDLSRVCNALDQGGWRLCVRTEQYEEWALGDLRCTLRYTDCHPEDALANRPLPADYRTLDVVLRTEGHDEPHERLPWEVLAKGMRVKDTRQEPIYVRDLSALVDLRPFHVELGCGVSIEAGVPALHHLHSLYRVTDLETGQFVFGGQEDDLMERLLLSPYTEFPKLGQLYRAAFVAEPSPAHLALLALHKEGHLVGSVMTNNFDGLAHRVGLGENFLRRYDEAIPDIELSSNAKSLLVVGSHADRRRVQARARARGLQVVYLDPEGYWDGGRFVSYPLEGPRSGDLACRLTATKGLTGLCSLLGIDIVSSYSA